MPTTLQVEIADDGAVGTLPEPLQKFLDKKINEAHSRAYQKAADEAKKQVGDPVDRERLRQLEEQTKQREIEDAERAKKYDEAIKLRDTDWQKKVSEREDALAKRDKRLRDNLQTLVRAAAVKAGARDQSLDELAVLLGGRLDLDDELNPYVKGADGKPATGSDGKPVSVEGLVVQYLTDHPHHKAGAGTSGGGARGGASLAGVSATLAQEVEQARRNWVTRKDADSLAAYQEAQRKLKASA